MEFYLPVHAIVYIVGLILFPAILYGVAKPQFDKMDAMPVILSILALSAIWPGALVALIIYSLCQWGNT